MISDKGYETMLGQPTHWKWQQAWLHWKISGHLCMCVCVITPEGNFVIKYLSVKLSDHLASDSGHKLQVILLCVCYMLKVTQLNVCHIHYTSEYLSHIEIYTIECLVWKVILLNVFYTLKVVKQFTVNVCAAHSWACLHHCIVNDDEHM